MSAFIVKNKTINNIVAVLARDEFMIRLINQEFNVNIKLDSGRSYFAHRLYALNVSSVGARYGSADDMVGNGFQYKHEYDVGILKSFKDLQCLLYQCDEGEVPSTKLFKFMDTVAFKHIAKKIIYDLPEYDLLGWG